MTTQENKNYLREKTKTFFQGEKWKNVLVFLGFLILAFGFWIMQYYQQKFEIEVSIPIHYTNVPPEVVLSSSLPDNLLVKVQDKGTVLLNYTSRRGSQSINLDLKNISLDKSSYTFDASALNNIINDRLTFSTQVLSFSPEKIQIDYSPLTKKELPVIFDGVLRPATGYMFVDSVQIEPTQVSVYGDKATLDTLNVIRTEHIEREDVKDKLDVKLKLVIPKGSRLSQESVNLTAAFEEYTEKTFELPVVCYNLPEDRIVRTFPSTVELIIPVVLSNYSNVIETDFEVSVDYNDLIGNKSTKTTVKLSKKPQWLQSYRIVPEMIEFLVEQKRDI